MFSDTANQNFRLIAYPVWLITILILTGSSGSGQSYQMEYDESLGIYVPPDSIQRRKDSIFRHLDSLLHPPVTLATISPPAGLSWGMNLSQVKEVLGVPLIESNGYYDSLSYYETNTSKQYRAVLNGRINTGIHGLEVHDIWLHFTKNEEKLVVVGVHMLESEAAVFYAFYDEVLSVRYRGARHEVWGDPFIAIDHTQVDCNEGRFSRSIESVVQEGRLCDYFVRVVYSHPRHKAMIDREKMVRDMIQRSNAKNSDF